MPLTRLDAAALLRAAQAHQRDDVGAVGVERQPVAHARRQRGGILERLVRRRDDVVEQVAHLVLPDRLTEVQAHDEEDRGGQRVAVVLGAQAADEDEARARNPSAARTPRSARRTQGSDSRQR